MSATRKSEMPVSKAKARIADLVERALHLGEITVVTRRGKIVGAFVGPDDLAKLESIAA